MKNRYLGLIGVLVALFSLLAIPTAQADDPIYPLGEDINAPFRIATDQDGIDNGGYVPEGTETAVVPLTGVRLYYNRGCIENHTGWTSYDYYQDVAASKWGEARDFDPLVSRHQGVSSCASFAGTPSYLTARLYREYDPAHANSCWRISGHNTQSALYGWYFWNTVPATNIYLNTAGSYCGVTPANSNRKAHQVSAAIGQWLGCQWYHGGAPGTTRSYSVMNIDRPDLAWQTGNDTTNADSCMNRRY